MNTSTKLKRKIDFNYFVKSHEMSSVTESVKLSGVVSYDG